MQRASINHPTTREMRGGMISLYLEGKDPGHIAQSFGVSRRTVERWIQRFRNEHTTKDRPRPGRPRVTTRHQDQEIVATMEADPKCSAYTVRDILQVECSIPTVQRRLRASGLKARIPAVKPALTERHKQDRLVFARRYAEMPLEFWKSVVFCDEKMFSSEGLRPHRVWRRRNTRFDDHNVVASTRSGRITHGVWGWMAWGCLGQLAEIEGRLTAVTYVDILEHVLIPSTRAVFADGERFHIYLAQDNSPIHSARIVRDWFVAHPEVTLIDWPAKSPDLNPTENLWAHISRRWIGYEGRSRRELFANVMELWERYRVYPDVTQQLVESMQRRLRNVIAANGSYTKY